MAALRGMEVIVLRPEGFALPRGHHGARAARGGARAGGSVRETSERAEALAGAHVLYVKEWGATDVLRRCGGGCARCARALTDWCVRDDWFASARPTAASCTACRCGATPPSPTRCSTAPRSIVQREAYNRLPAQMAVLHQMLRS